MNHRLQIIGTYLEDLVWFLEEKNIRIENVINKVNPITMMYEPDKEQQHYCNIIVDECACLDIKKNLEQVLSHEPQKFESNIIKTKFGQEVRYVNNSDYILVYNSYINSKLLMYNDVIYTYKTPFNEFEKTISQNKDAVLDYTYLLSMDWKKYYDRFIDVILEEYDSKHIILLRNAISPYYVNEKGIQFFNKDLSEYKAFVEEMDAYFWEKTKCHCIDDLYYSVSDRNPNCISPAELRSRETMRRVADKVEKIIRCNEESECYQQDLFWCNKEDNISAISDIITLYKFYDLYHRKIDFQNLVESVVVNDKLFNKNKEYLMGYPYISGKIDFSVKQDEQYVALEHGYYLRLQCNPEPFMALENYRTDLVYEFKDVQKNNYIIPWEYAETFCGDLKLYIERARKGCGNKPVRICFSDVHELMKTMYLVDWTYILESEKFVLQLEVDDDIVLTNYQTRTNLEFLFQENVKIFVMQSGLCDQVFRYILAQYLYADTEAKVFYDDTRFIRTKTFNGFELNKIIKIPIESKYLLSNVFSAILIEKNFLQNIGAQIADILCDAGLDNLLVLCNDEVRRDMVKKAESMYFQGSYCFNQIKEQHNSLQYLHLSPAVVPSPKLVEKHIHFPPFKNQRNIFLASSMQSCDAVVMHIRRGDFGYCDRILSSEFYFESLKKIKSETNYENIKLYVFSDDITWCKEHENELGLGMFPDTAVYFVDNNKNEESYRDIQLMSLGKIIIGSDSGFVRLAVLMSKRIEIFMCSDVSLMKGMERFGYKMLHNLSPYEKDYKMLEKGIELWRRTEAYIE